MKHKHGKQQKSSRTKLSVVIEKLEKNLDQAEPAFTTCVPHVYCMPPV
jgi:hypothetical protein